MGGPAGTVAGLSGRSAFKAAAEMRLSRLLRRNLTYYWRTNLAVVAGVATAAAVLSGALLVGDSVRASLLKLIEERLGGTDYVISADHFFRDELAAALVSDSAFARGFRAACPLILAQGIVTHEKSGLRAYRVNVYGVDARFWRFNGRETVRTPEAREALIGETLARATSAQPGDTLLLRINRDSDIPEESLFGRREDTGRTLRLTCREILDPKDLGEYSLRPSQGGILSMFVPLERLQRDLQQPGKVNAVLVAGSDGADRESQLGELLGRACSLPDLGLDLRTLDDRGALSLESPRILLNDPLADAAVSAAADSGLQPVRVLTYLANAIRAERSAIPYSVISATDLLRRAGSRVRVLEGSLRADDPHPLPPIWLNEWAQLALSVRTGATIEVDYNLWLDEGRLEERTAKFRLAGVVALEGDAADPGLAPDYPGITDAANMGSWDPPFPIDLKRIRPVDEEYWQRYRTIPKAFITLSQGEELWSSRFGRATSIRAYLAPGGDLRTAAAAYGPRLIRTLGPAASGLAVRFVRGRNVDASRGSTNFGEYFLYFSFFLICSAILLAALFFRFGLEQRIREIGLLESVGFAPAAIRKIFVLEALALSTLGSALGAAGSFLYAWLLLFGLRTWWFGAVGTSLLNLHLSWPAVLAGAGGGTLAATCSVALTLRGMRRYTPRAMLAGALMGSAERRRGKRTSAVVAAASLLLGLLLALSASLAFIGEEAGFFGAGTLMLVSALSLVSVTLQHGTGGRLRGHGWPAIVRLGGRNASCRPGRSVLCISLIASATFVIVSLEAFRKDPSRVTIDKKSGTGGYSLVGESVLPLVHDVDSPEGKEAMSLTPDEISSLEGVRFTPFRLRPGDDASCLNLYTPQEPRVLGASKDFVERAGFSFQASMARTREEEENPWLLLRQSFSDGAIPAIGDANTITYILHRKLGDELQVTGAGGKKVRLRIVGALRDSIFQGEVVISGERFLSAFPELQGFNFFLIEAREDRAEAVTQSLERGLADFGMDVNSTREKLSGYHRVENTYLSTFQSLGALGLLLGTIGLAAVLLRNVLERRAELALLRAVGFRRSALAVLILVENAVLIAAGLAAGTLCALLAITPAWTARGGPFPFLMLAVILAGVLCTGMLSSVLAVLAALRTPLLPALRSA